MSSDCCNREAMWFCCQIWQCSFKTCLGPLEIWKTWNGWSHVVYPCTGNTTSKRFSEPGRALALPAMAQRSAVRETVVVDLTTTSNVSGPNRPSTGRERSSPRALRPNMTSTSTQTSGDRESDLGQHPFTNWWLVRGSQPPLPFWSAGDQSSRGNQNPSESSRLIWHEYQHPTANRERSHRTYGRASRSRRKRGRANNRSSRPWAVRDLSVRGRDLGTTLGTVRNLTTAPATAVSSTLLNQGNEDSEEPDTPARSSSSPVQVHNHPEESSNQSQPSAPVSKPWGTLPHERPYPPFPQSHSSSMSSIPHEVAGLSSDVSHFGMEAPKGVRQAYSESSVTVSDVNISGRVPSTECTSMERHLEYYAQRHKLEATEVVKNTVITYHDPGSIEQVNQEHQVEFVITGDLSRDTSFGEDSQYESKQLWDLRATLAKNEDEPGSIAGDTGMSTDIAAGGIPQAEAVEIYDYEEPENYIEPGFVEHMQMRSFEDTSQTSVQEQHPLQNIRADSGYRSLEYASSIEQQFGLQSSGEVVEYTSLDLETSKLENILEHEKIMVAMPSSPTTSNIETWDRSAKRSHRTASRKRREFGVGGSHRALVHVVSDIDNACPPYIKNYGSIYGRDYSVDKKSDALFREFSRCDYSAKVRHRQLAQSYTYPHGENSKKLVEKGTHSKTLNIPEVSTDKVDIPITMQDEENNEYKDKIYRHEENDENNGVDSNEVEDIGVNEVIDDTDYYEMFKFQENKDGGKGGDVHVKEEIELQEQKYRNGKAEEGRDQKEEVEEKVIVLEKV